MADNLDRPNTHLSDFQGTIRVESSAPSNPLTGDMYYNTANNMLSYYDGSQWIGAPFTRV